MRTARCSFAVAGTLLALSMSSLAQADNADLFRTLSPASTSLDSYRWKQRPVVIFAPSAQDADYVRQLTLLQQHQQALRERDMVVLSDIRPADNGVLRKALNPAGFEIVLVGKDGGMKLRQTTPVSADALLSLVDSMPMRQAGQK
ncbi:DUF4174 domain-containing protein [Pantoea eucrina]|uniref:DUF4174 domain-containing protein n=1 Tax=Pantoea eucrina TaxID=472693 RepID=A0ABS1Z7T4_9GAMM|nr:DUF4174 domain-containing protein [Pantoea eucrina]MBM0748455.1 DUF4174 domain-containing protein [Pantoea eucrina]WDS96705.1 hypothetical protein DUF4174 [Pantoea sp.]